MALESIGIVLWHFLCISIKSILWHQLVVCSYGIATGTGTWRNRSL